MNSENNKLCPFCESEMMIIQDNLNNGKPYLECPTCGLRFQIEGFPEIRRKSEKLSDLVSLICLILM